MKRYNVVFGIELAVAATSDAEVAALYERLKIAFFEAFHETAPGGDMRITGLDNTAEYPLPGTQESDAHDPDVCHDVTGSYHCGKCGACCDFLGCRWCESEKVTQALEEMRSETSGPRVLPVFRGWTVDARLREFRRVKADALGGIEFLRFDSDEGDALVNEYVRTLSKDDLDKYVRGMG